MPRYKLTIGGRADPMTAEHLGVPDDALWAIVRRVDGAAKTVVAEVAVWAGAAGATREAFQIRYPQDEIPVYALLRREGPRLLAAFRGRP